MKQAINSAELQVIWGSVSMLRQRCRAKDWVNARALYFNLMNYELQDHDRDVRLINMVREACEFYTEQYNDWLRGEVFCYA